MQFGKSLGKAGFGWGSRFGDDKGGNFGGDKGGYENKGKAFGNDEENKKFVPGQDEGGDDENKEEKKPEDENKEGGDQGDLINQVVELYDQLTPLIDKLRKS